MSNIVIIKDGAALNKRMNSTLKTYASVGARIHVEVVSALWHAATNGNPFYINRIYSELRSNDQTAVKLYIRRISAIVGLDGADPEGLPSETVIAAVEQGGILTLKKGEFIVTKGHTTPQAKAWADLTENRFLNPDGETDRAVLDRNNFAEVKTLGDDAVLDQLMKLVSSTETETDTRKVAITAPVRDFLLSLKDKAEVLRNQLSLSQG
jgi:hypothetical protein